MNKQAGVKQGGQKWVYFKKFLSIIVLFSL